jgi:hypothetical protein
MASSSVDKIGMRAKKHRQLVTAPDRQIKKSGKLIHQFTTNNNNNS